MTDTSLLIEIDPRGIASVTINRPEVLNAFDEDLIGQISSAFESLDTNPAVRIVVLRRRGARFVPAPTSDGCNARRPTRSTTTWTMRVASRP